MGLYRRCIFPWAVEFTLQKPEHAGRRRQLLETASGIMCEIGFGTGLNLPFYPKRVERLVAIEPNPGMARRAGVRIAGSSFPVELHTAAGEQLPLADASCDGVVSTYTLCSVVEPGRVLAEVRRVLRPDGRFFVLEHGLHPDPAVQRWQRWLNPLQRIVGDGCNLDRDMLRLIEDNGFRFGSMERFQFEKAPRIAGYMYMGIARVA